MHWFLRRLLNEWSLELQHLNSTGVLHIAGFITVYEAFLGMEPHMDLFWLFFSGRAMTVGNSAETAPVAGFTLQRKLSAGGVYPVYSPCDSNWGWHGEWFYIRNPVEAPFLAFIGGRLAKKKSWSWGCTCIERHKVDVIDEELWKLIRLSLDGVRVFHTLYRRRVAPLAERTHPM